MRREIDILLRAASRNCAIVEKTSHMRWSWEDLVQARDAGQFQVEDELHAPDCLAEPRSAHQCFHVDGVSSCMPFRPVGQTKHFVILTADAEANASSG